MNLTKEVTLEKKTLGESFLIMLGLFTISASTLMVEIVLTKFLSFKVYHHYTYAVISVVIFTFGLSGFFIYLMSDLLNKVKDFLWSWISRVACLYSITLIISIILFAWIPIDPYSTNLSSFLKVLALPLYFLIFCIPFFLSGLCISCTLCYSTQPVMKIYFWDLLGAAVGAFLCPILLSKIGGYGLISTASILGILASLFYHGSFNLSFIRKRLILLLAFFVCQIVLIAYPVFATKFYGFDIRSTKDEGQKKVLLKDFGGIKLTNWNAIARIDVSGTADSRNGLYRYGLSRKSYDLSIPGRFITVDGGANTRQFKVTGEIADQSFLKEAIWAAPYVINSKPEEVLIFGAGGGIDILEAKYFGVSKVDAVELNPFTFKLLTGKAYDPESNNYLPWLESNSKTHVTIHNSEARHFSTKCKANSYDIILASGVDTLTAITTGGNSLVENYLYTIDAVRDYFKLLRQNGILSLTHWRRDPPSMALRMFLTYIKFLENIGVKEPQKYIIVIGDAEHGWVNSLLKKSPFTEVELENIRNWTKEIGYTILFDPGRTIPPESGLIVGEEVYTQLGFANETERKNLLKQYIYNVNPVSDEKPYFYHLSKHTSLLSLFENNLGVFFMFLASIIASVMLIIVPIIKYEYGKNFKDIFCFCMFFALCGFGFMLFEISIIQKLAVFVGGPTYSLSVVLVCVLFGYAVGSYFAQFLVQRKLTFILLGVILGVAFFMLYSLLPSIITILMPCSFLLRLIFSGVVSLIISIFTAVPLTLGMDIVRKRYGSVVGWMWGINSTFNVVGGMSFLPLSQVIGISGNFLIVLSCYFLANIIFGLILKD